MRTAVVVCIVVLLGVIKEVPDSVASVIFLLAAMQDVKEIFK